MSEEADLLARLIPPQRRCRKRLIDFQFGSKLIAS